MELLTLIENSGIATWIREADSPFAYTLFLALHAIGLAFLVGPNTAINLRILGFAPRLPLGPMKAYFPLMWAAFWVNAASGLVLLSLEATNFLTMPTFYIKMAAVGLAVANLRLIRSRVFGNLKNLDTKPVPATGRILAGTSLAFWAVAILAGRVTAYDTYIKWETALAVLIVSGVMMLVGSIAVRIFGSGGHREPSVGPDARIRGGV